VGVGGDLRFCSESWSDRVASTSGKTWILKTRRTGPGRKEGPGRENKRMKLPAYKSRVKVQSSCAKNFGDCRGMWSARDIGYLRGQPYSGILYSAGPMSSRHPAFRRLSDSMWATMGGLWFVSSGHILPPFRRHDLSGPDWGAHHPQGIGRVNLMVGL